MGGAPSPTIVESTTTQSSGPPEYAQPYVEQLLEGAQARYEDPSAPAFFPGQTYVEQSPETLAALEGATQRALAGSPIADVGAQQYLATTGGAYLDPASNPYLRATQEAAIAPVAERLQEQTLPSILASAGGGGRYGSPLMMERVGNVTRDATRAMLDASSNLAYRNYADERNRQMQGIMGAPQYAQQDYLDIERLGDVGQAREAQAGRELQDAMSRFDFETNLGQQKLIDYGNVLRQGIYGGTGTTTQQTPFFGPSPLSQGLGAASTIGGLALGAK